MFRILKRKVKEKRGEKKKEAKEKRFRKSS